MITIREDNINIQDNCKLFCILFMLLKPVLNIIQTSDTTNTKVLSAVHIDSHFSLRHATVFLQDPF